MRGFLGEFVDSFEDADYGEDAEDGGWECENCDGGLDASRDDAGFGL